MVGFPMLYFGVADPPHIDACAMSFPAACRSFLPPLFESGHHLPSFLPLPLPKLLNTFIPGHKGNCDLGP
jgi:hypothetical protein